MNQDPAKQVPTYDGAAKYDSGIRYPAESSPPTVKHMYNIKLPFTDEVEADWMADLNTLKTKMEEFKPQDPSAADLWHIKPEDLECLEVVRAWASAHSDRIPTKINLDDYNAIMDMAVAASRFVERFGEVMNLASLIALVSRNYAYDTSRKIYRAEQANGRDEENSTVLDSFGQRFEKTRKSTTTPSKPTT